MPAVDDERFFSVDLRTLRRVALVLAVIGAAWAVLETAVAFDVLGDDSPISPFEGREGTGVGIAMLALAATSLAGAALVVRVPSLAAAALFAGACGGFLAVGAPWAGPGALLGLGSWLCLLSIPNPFRDEMAREAAQGDAGGGEPSR